MGLIVDLFAGGGGASLGIERALGRPIDIAVNHDPRALAMHRANHPATRHLCEDVFAVDPREATGGRPVDVMWCSPDCAHHSKAKGGQPREKKIRGLAWAVLKWTARTRPKAVFLENVEEFANWGPLTRSKKPCKRRRGWTFEQWVSQFRSLGYAIDWWELKACDFGTPTIRKRLFLVARRDGLPIVRPAPTHGPEGSGLESYHTAAEIIDWSIPCPSIFMTKAEATEYRRLTGIQVNRPLAEKTMRRIARGVVRFVIEAKEPFIVGVGGRAGQSPERGLSEPLGTITAKNDRALIAPLLSKYHGAKSDADARGGRLDEPLRTLDTQNRFALVAPLLSRQFGNSVGSGVDAPAPTVMPGGGGKTALVAAFLAQHNTGMVGRGAREPLSTITGRATQQQVVAALLSHQYTSNTRGGQGDLHYPLKTVLTGNHAAAVYAFLTKYYGTGGQWQDCRDPLHTATAKARFGVVIVEVGGEPYVITDIGMRMLCARELFNAQGFPETYVIDPLFEGRRLTDTIQKRMCGNSVCPDPAEALIRANVAGIMAERGAA